MKTNKLNQKFDSSDILCSKLKNDNLQKTPEQKIKKIELYIKNILNILGIDLNNDSLKSTPKRVAEMYVKEIFSGLLPENIPKNSTFKNSYKYKEMLIEKNISIFSTCEHHLLPIIGTAHVAYISNGTIIGLSTINEIVNFYSKRPQMQERLTIQIVSEMKKMLNTEDVACLIKAHHFCVISRGIKNITSSTITTELSGVFKKNLHKQKFFLDSITMIK